MGLDLLPTPSSRVDRRPSRRRHSAARAVAALLAALLAAGSPAWAATASGEIAEDTVWEGVVDVTGEVRVPKGVTLVIQPGATVRFAPVRNAQGQPTARLYASGTIVAQGTADKPISFVSAAPEPRPGDWGGIVIENSVEKANRLRHVSIRHADIGVIASHTVLLVEDSVFRDNVKGFYGFQDVQGWMFGSTLAGNGFGLHFNQSSGFHVENCEITGNSRVGILCVLNSAPTIRLCTIADNAEDGIQIVQGSSPLIEGNTIRGSRRGIALELQTRPKILNNEIRGNETGIWGEKMVFPWIAGNVITANGIGIYCNYSAYMQIRGNNLHDNRTFGLVIGDNMSILMQNKIPFRYMGRFSFDAEPSGAKDVPHQSRRFDPFLENAGVVDARANWWGGAATAEMEELGEDGNISVIQDFFDKPDTFYGKEVYRRDRVSFAGWEKEPLKDAGPPARLYSAIGGKVVFAGKPVAGVRVHVYADAKSGFRGEGVAYSAPTADDGSFSINAPAATYYLIAKGPSPPLPFREPGGGDLFGYYGGNPVTVSPAVVSTSNLQVVRRVAPVVTNQGYPAQSRIEGTVTGPAGPVEGAFVHVYTDASRQFRGPDLFGPQGAVAGGTDAKGGFSIELPPGTYFLVASKRKGGDLLGPLQPGDLHGYFDGNPLELAAGTVATVALQVVEKLRDAAAPSGTKTGTVIRGRVRDPAGGVPKSVYAFATTDPSFMIGAMPPYRSQPLAADGSYSIELPAGNTYYVSARSGYGGPPLPGEWHGFYGEKTPRPIAVGTNQAVEGVDFVVRKME